MLSAYVSLEISRSALHGVHCADARRARFQGGLIRRVNWLFPTGIWMDIGGLIVADFWSKRINDEAIKVVLGPYRAQGSSQVAKSRWATLEWSPIA